MVLLRTSPRHIRPPPTAIVTAPFTVVIDDREKDAGWTFQGMIERRAKRDFLVVVPIRYQRLLTGDYTLAGLEDMVILERKSLSDLYGSLSAPHSDPERRNRFKAEHQRMKEIIDGGGHACVIVESSFPDIYHNPPPESGLNPNSVLGTLHSWSIRYGVSWEFGGDRRGAEVLAYGRLKAAWEIFRERAGGNGRNELTTGSDILQCTTRMETTSHSAKAGGGPMLAPSPSGTLAFGGHAAGVTDGWPDSLF